MILDSKSFLAGEKNEWTAVISAELEIKWSIADQLPLFGIFGIDHGGSKRASQQHFSPNSASCLRYRMMGERRENKSWIAFIEATGALEKGNHQRYSQITHVAGF